MSEGTKYVVLVHSQAQEIEVVAEKVESSSTNGSGVRFLSGDGSQLAFFRLSDEGSGWWAKDAGKQSKAAPPALPPAPHVRRRPPR